MGIPRGARYPAPAGPPISTKELADACGWKPEWLQRCGRLARRITSWVEFKGIDLEDSRIVADTLCEVRVADDLIAHLHKEAKANIGRIVVGLSRIERVGLTSGVETVSLADWRDRPLFFDQPNFRKRRE